MHFQQMPSGTDFLARYEVGTPSPFQAGVPYSPYFFPFRLLGIRSLSHSPTDLNDSFTDPLYSRPPQVGLDPAFPRN